MPIQARVFVAGNALAREALGSETRASAGAQGRCVRPCLDGSIAKFHFEAKELGHRLSDSELDELKKSRYGDVRGRQSNLAESPAQLLLEEASVKQLAGKKEIH